MPVEIWKDEYFIHSYEVDTNGQLTIPCLCQYLQESGWRHAENFGVGFTMLLEKKLAWVLTRQIIAMDVYPHWGDTIKVHTWPTGKDRLFWYRDFLILDQDENQLGRATTAWLVIDLETRRPQRTDIMNIPLHDNSQHLFTDRPQKIKGLHEEACNYDTPARYQNLDVNQHVNNISYIKWMLDTFDLEHYKKYQLKRMAINFMSESIYGDEISVFKESTDPLAFRHKVARSRDAADLCRAETEWETLNVPSKI